MRLTSLCGATLVAAAFVAFAAARGGAEDAPSSGGDKPQYLGDKACMKCHFQEHKSWKKTALFKSMKTLAPTAEADNKALFDKKKAAGLDPAKDYSADEACVKCHVTGYGDASGYPKDPKANDEAAKKAAALGNVGCEVCHGPGSLYVKHKIAELEKNKDAKFTFDDMSKLGLVKPDEKVCVTCHNSASPTKEEFKFDEAKAKVHDHVKK